MNPRSSIFTLFVLLLSFFGSSQQYNFRNYNVEDGLGQSQVYAIHQDALGQLWLGTRGSGISVFNGFEFQEYTSKHGLPSNYINDIIADTSGRIWVATNKGLSYFTGTGFKAVSLPNGKKNLTIHDLFLAKNGKLYCSSSNGIFYIDGENSTDLSDLVRSKLNVGSIYVDEEGQVWMGRNDGFFSFEKGQMKSHGLFSNYMNNSITTIERDNDGTFWIGTYGDGMYCYDGEKYFRVDYHHELYRQTVLDIHLDERQNLWIATLAGGVIHYDRTTRTFTSITENEGLSNNHVRSIIQDNNGNFWFGTSGGGVCHYLGKQFTNYDIRSGLAGNYIYSVLRDKNGNLWIGNSQKGVSTLNQEGFVNYDASNGFQNVKVKAIGEDKLGNIWLGTDGRGVYVYREGEFEAIEELRRAYVKQIKRDANGHIWIATAGSGIIEVTPRENNFVIEKWTMAEGLISNRIATIHFDKNGRLWYGSEGDGIGCMNKQGKHVLKFSESDGLPSNQIRSLVEDKKGRLWIGTAGEGLCAINMYESGKRLKTISEKDGLKSNNIYLLSIDNDGNIIAGTEKGLDYIYFGEDGAAKQIKHYGKLDGFTGVETCQNATWKDDNGALWFGTINGLCRFNPSELVLNNQAPILSLRDIKLFYESILGKSPVLIDGQQAKALQLEYGENHISFDFLGVNLKRPQSVMYQWRLLGFDENWSPPSKDRSILYSNLNPGTYVFQLKASNEDGIWSEQPLEFRFEIETPYWQETWFIVLCIISGFVLLFVIYILSTNRIRKKALEKQHQIALEKDFLELEQKAMRLQMNPHFIFNALNSIQSLIGTGKETEARYYLAKFSRLMRQILDNSRKSDITLEEEINTLENYLLVEQFCNGDRFQYTIDVVGGIESDFIHIPPMLIQPFVENAIKHGMKGRSEQSKDGKIELRFSEKNGILECIIEDNGIGREQAAKLKEASKETYHKSTGLAVTTERLNLMGLADDVEPFEIVDLYTDGKASGTRVIIRIPIE